MNFNLSFDAKNKFEKKNKIKKEIQKMEFENSMLIINPIMILQNSYYIRLQ